jgi:membrane-bound ClpP family serine protease
LPIILIGINTQEKRIIQEQKAITDKLIDQLVYDLYDLTDEESYEPVRVEESIVVLKFRTSIP